MTPNTIDLICKDLNITSTLKPCQIYSHIKLTGDYYAVPDYEIYKTEKLPMKLMNILSAFVGLTIYAFIPTVYANDVLLFDNFNSENNGFEELSYDRFANWYVTRGEVHLLQGGQHNSHPDNGLYLDFDTLSDSNTSMYGVRVGSKKEFALAPGKYKLSFDILNLSTAFSAPNLNFTVLVSLGDVYSETFTLPEKQSFQNIERIINVTLPSEGSLVFEKTVIKIDGKRIQNGTGLDNVQLRKIPD
jgi:hypothetical protein